MSPLVVIAAGQIVVGVAARALGRRQARVGTIAGNAASAASTTDERHAIR